MAEKLIEQERLKAEKNAKAHVDEQQELWEQKLRLTEDRLKRQHDLEVNTINNLAAKNEEELQRMKQQIHSMEDEHERALETGKNGNGEKATRVGRSRIQEKTRSRKRII